jgi:hypothetical protein
MTAGPSLGVIHHYEDYLITHTNINVFHIWYLNLFEMSRPVFMTVLLRKVAAEPMRTKLYRVFRTSHGNLHPQFEKVCNKCNMS